MERNKEEERLAQNVDLDVGSTLLVSNRRVNRSAPRAKAGLDK
jgi:hypothetical protein